MKRILLGCIAGIIIVVVHLSPMLILSQKNNASLHAAESANDNYRWIIIEPFNECQNWKIANTPYAGDNYYKTDPVLVKYPNVPSSEVFRQDSINAGEDPESDGYCLGVNTTLPWSDCQSISITPRNPIPLGMLSNRQFMSGPLKGMSIWVNGRNYPLVLYAWVRNGDGQVFKVQLGHIEHYGWKKLDNAFINYSGWMKGVKTMTMEDIPQYKWDHPNFHPPEFLRFQLANPLGIPIYSRGYIYFDQLRVLVDLTSSVPDDENVDMGTYELDGTVLFDKWGSDDKYNRR